MCNKFINRLLTIIYKMTRLQANSELIEKVYEFEQTLRQKNRPLATRISKALIPLLEYEGTLQEITSKELFAIRAVGQEGAKYLLRVLQGDDIASIIADIPTWQKPYRCSKRRTNWTRNRIF